MDSYWIAIGFLLDFGSVPREVLHVSRKPGSQVQKTRSRKPGSTGGRFCFDLGHFGHVFGWSLGVIYRSLGVICTFWSTVLQIRPSGERLDGFQTVGAVLRRGRVARRGHLGVPLGPVWLHFGHHFLMFF